MTPDATPGIIAHAIQLAIAPVFLLTGVAGLLGVMANRLTRIIDRGRYFEQHWAQFDAKTREACRAELDQLEERRRVCSWAINFSTATALIVCVVIVALFVEAFFSASLKWAAGGLFVLAMLSLIGGLTCFLREVYLSTHSTGIDVDRWR